MGCTAERPRGGEKEEGFFKRAPKLIAVTAVTVTPREVPWVIHATGKTEASDRFEAKAAVNVRIQKVFVEEGGRVQPGDPLVKVDDEITRLRLNKARAEVREAEAAIEQDTFLQQNRDRLLEEEKLSEIEAEGLDERVELHRATLDRAKAEIELYERLAEVDQFNSPIAGVVTKRHASEGTDVAEGQTLVEVVRLDPLRFVFTAPMEAATALEREAEVSVRFPSAPGQEFTGELLAVGAEVRGEAGGVEVKLNLPNPDFLLKAEMKGEVTVRTPARRRIYPVAEGALVRSERSTFVFRVVGENGGEKARKVVVELGEPYNGQPTIEKGVSEGDLIVVEAEGDLKDGSLVEVRK